MEGYANSFGGGRKGVLLRRDEEVACGEDGRGIPRFARNDVGLSWRWIRKEKADPSLRLLAAGRLGMTDTFFSGWRAFFGVASV